MLAGNSQLSAETVSLVRRRASADTARSAVSAISGTPAFDAVGVVLSFPAASLASSAFGFSWVFGWGVASDTLSESKRVSDVTPFFGPSTA